MSLKIQLTKKFQTGLLKPTNISATLKILLPVSHISNKQSIGLQNEFDGECETRIEEEKNIMQTVDDTKYDLHKKIDAERTDKSLKLGAFKDDTLKQLTKQHKYVEEF